MPIKKCVRCEAPIEPGISPFPFCSERCRLIDLGRWASEDYIIEGNTPPSELRTSEAEASDEAEELPPESPKQRGKSS